MFKEIYIRKESDSMTIYEIVSVYLEILSLLISLCSMIFVFLSYITKVNKKK